MKRLHQCDTSCFIFFVGVLILLFSGCKGDSSQTPVSLSADNINLIFVVSPDLSYHAPGDIDEGTANLTGQGLGRSLLMATFLKQQVLGTNNVSSVYALEPMTHLQTPNNYPDMAAIVFIQQFALLNQITLSYNGSPVTANSYPINASYAPGSVPGGVAPPAIACAGCQGLDFNDQGGDNETLVSGIIKANVPGFYVFSAPWETVRSLLANINSLHGYNLVIPQSYEGPNHIFAISVTPSGGASLVTFDSGLNPSSTYPELPSPVPVTSACTAQEPFRITVTGGRNRAVIPSGINTNETIYIIRHAEAHPGYFDDGNYVCAGQWRALALPGVLRGKISPDQIYSVDPAQVIPGTVSASGNSHWSYVRTSLTVAPYAIANKLPYNLAASFAVFAQNPPELATQASDFFFSGGKFSNQKILLGWESQHIPTTVNALLARYFPRGGGPTAPGWPSDDYDTIWTVTLDARGNLTVDNFLCEGIDSKKLPATCPEF
jgi:hypothetical protein